MIAVGADSQEPQLASSFDNVPASTVGDELPSLSCDLNDLNITSNDIDLLLLQNLSNVNPDSLEACMQLGSSAASDYLSSHPVSSSQDFCDFTSVFAADSPRPRDLNLSFPDEIQSQGLMSRSATSFGMEVPCGIPGDVTPPLPGGVTPQNLSRAASPTWSESSGNMSTGTMAGSDSSRASRSSNPVPRHKRPSHKRAEMKRRDKIKTCLDDIKEQVPSLRDKGKLSESAILTKAAEYVHQLKDGYTDRGSKAAELRREIQCLSAEIHSFQENLPESGLDEKTAPSASLDDLYKQWVAENCQYSPKFFIFSSITAKLFETFKEVVGPVISWDGLVPRVQEWQEKCLGLPVLRKEILNGMLALTRKMSIVKSPDSLEIQLSTNLPQTKNEENNYFTQNL